MFAQPHIAPSVNEGSAIVVLSTAICLVASLSSVRDIAAQAAVAEPPTVTTTDYARAEGLLGVNAGKLVSGRAVAPVWLDEQRFWFDDTTTAGRQFVLVDIGRGTRAPAFDHASLAAALSRASRTSVVPGDLPFSGFQFDSTGTAIDFVTGLDMKSAAFGADSVLEWGCTITSYQCSQPTRVAPPSPAEILSPDGRWWAFVRDDNLWLRSTQTGDSVQLSTDGVNHYGYGTAPEGCCWAVSSRLDPVADPPVVSWSPDGKRLAATRYDERHVESLHLLETVEGRPVLHSYRYALPGDSVFPTYDIYIFDVDSARSVKVQTDPLVGNFSTEFSPIWGAVRWSTGGDRLFFTRHDAAFDSFKLLVADAETGATTVLIEETQPTFVDLNQIAFLPDNWQPVSGGNEILWFSERDGWGHLYLYDARTGDLKNQVTSGPWLMLDVQYVDEANRLVFFTGVGREGGDPYLPYLYRVGFDGSDLRLLTPEPADHAVQLRGGGGRYFVDNVSRRDTAPTSVVRELSTGRIVQTINRGDVSALLAAGWQWPIRVRAKARDGVTDLHGLLHLPADMDSTARYPVIVHVYPGPQIGSILTRSFTTSPFGEVQALASLGFFVVTVDALGTPMRSKAFHDFDYGDLGDNGLPDQIAVVRQLAARYPQMDLGRVGIYGHSGGGTAAAAAVLKFPEFFKVAVAGAGNHDNESYFFAWGNKYQGLLDRDSVTGTSNYDDQANQNLAGNLAGRLLLTFGTMDDNVHPNNTLLLINELIAHDKDFDVLVLPNRNHMYMMEPYVIRKTWDYFVRHLQGVEPPRYTMRTAVP